MSQELLDSPQALSRSSRAFLFGTALSRLSGFGRDMVTALVFGSHPAVAAFMVAFRFANLLRRLFGEGPLASGFVPGFEQQRALSPKAGAEFFRDLFFSLCGFLLLLTALMEGVLWGILPHLSPSNAQIVELTMRMLPGSVFICLFGLSSALLQCRRQFFLTGLAPIGFNLVWIVCALFVQKQAPSAAVFSLSSAVVVAFFMQFALLIPSVYSELKGSLSWKECFAPRLFSQELKALLKPLLLGLVGISAVQINSTLDALFARASSLEGPAYLWYAIRLEQVPLAFFGIALSSALLPPLARALKEGAQERYLSLLRFAMRKGFSLIFPCTIALFILGLSGINVLYGHGHFTSEAVYQTTLCLWGYGLGLLPSVFVLFLAPAFYADRQFLIPTKASMLSVGCHLCLASFFVFVCGWGAFSIALATGLCAWVNYFYLSSQLKRKVGQSLRDRAMSLSFLKTALSTLVALLGTLAVGLFFVDDPTLALMCGSAEILFVRDFQLQCMQFLALSGVFVVLFFLSARLFRAEEALELIRIKS